MCKATMARLRVSIHHDLQEPFFASLRGKSLSCGKRKRPTHPPHRRSSRPAQRAQSLKNWVRTRERTKYAPLRPCSDAFDPLRSEFHLGRIYCEKKLISLHEEGTRSPPTKRNHALKPDSTILDSNKEVLNLASQRRVQQAVDLEEKVSHIDLWYVKRDNCPNWKSHSFVPRAKKGKLTQKRCSSAIYQQVGDSKTQTRPPKFTSAALAPKEGCHLAHCKKARLGILLITSRCCGTAQPYRNNEKSHVCLTFTPTSPNRGHSSHDLGRVN